MAQPACQQFEVGTRAWTDCVEDAATGGGLMPWIVVVPLGVMVIGMAIGFARQFSPAGRRRAAAHGTSGTAGSWLIFVAMVELAIGVGSFIGARRGGETTGFTSSGTILTSVGVLLLVIGVFLKIKGRRRARIYHSGLPGQAVVRDIRETGMMVNNNPMYEFDLDVEGSGFAPTSATHREVVPLWMAGRIGPQMKVPVKVDPSNPSKLIFDWDALRSVAAVAAPFVQRFSGATGATGEAGPTPADAQGFAAPATPDGPGFAAPDPGVLGAGDVKAALDAAHQMTGGRSGWHVGKAIGAVVLLFVIAIVGGALYFFASIFSTVSDATDAATDQVRDAFEDVGNLTAGLGGGGGAGTRIEISRPASGRDDVGYSLALPVGWLDLTASEEEQQGPLVVDLVIKPPPPSQARIVVTRSVKYLQDPAPAADDVRSIRRAIEGEYGDTLERSRMVRLDGEPAVAMEVTGGADGLRSRQLAVLRGGQVIFVAYTAPAGEFASGTAVFEDVVASWRWSDGAAR